MDKIIIPYIQYFKNWPRTKHSFLRANVSQKYSTKKIFLERVKEQNIHCNENNFQERRKYSFRIANVSRTGLGQNILIQCLTDRRKNIHFSEPMFQEWTKERFINYAEPMFRE